MKKSNFYFVALAAFVLFSCVSTVSTSTNTTITKTIPLGHIATEGIEIRDEDGSFVLKSGEHWSPPLEQASPILLGTTPVSTDSYIYVLKHLGTLSRKVRVKVPYQSEELYGVLLLQSSYEDCASAVTRSYQISIPKNYVDAAQNGKVSVLYEYYNCRGKSYSTWVLWLSDIPFN